MKKKSLLFILFILLLCLAATNVKAQLGCAWALNPQAVSPLGGQIWGQSIKTDAAGNSYITGWFYNTADFDPGAGTAALTSAGNSDIFIAKYDAAGNYIYAKRMGGGSNDYTYSIDIDAAGNTYITGYFYGTADFDPGAGTAYLTAAGNNDIYFAKYDAAGNYVYAKSIGGTGSDIGRSIVIDAAGNAYITGNFQLTADFDPGIGTANLTSAGSVSVFLAKYDASGNYLYAKNIGGGSAWGYSIAIDASGNAYITGNFLGTVDFDPGAGAVNLSSSGGYDIFIAKYDASGNYIYAKTMGGNGADYGHNIAIDASGNAYLIGFFESTVDFDPGPGVVSLTSAGANDIFFARYDASGNFVYVKQIGGTGYDNGYSIAIDAAENAYITGFYQGTVDFDPGVVTANLTAAGSYEIFVAKYDASGNYIYAKSIGGTSTDIGNSIAIDASGNAYVTGYFQNTADFDPGTGTANLSIISGNDNAFIAKYNTNGAYVWAGAIGGYSNTSCLQAANCVKVDNAGNSYMTGYFLGSIDFDPGIGTAILTSVGGWDIFIAKYDVSGNFIYAKGIAGSSYEVGNSIAVDATGNVYITGYYQGTVDFDPGAGIANLTPAGQDIYFAKYDAAGNYVYAKSLGGADNDQGFSIAVDVAGNVYITGYFRGTADFDPGAGTANLTSAAENDIFFAKYDAGGNYVYAKSIGGSSQDIGNSLAVDAAGNVYLTGGFYYTVDFNPGAGTDNLTASDRDIFIAKYDATGNYVFAKSMGGPSIDNGNSIAVDASGNVYITGLFYSTADFDPGPGTVNHTSSGQSDIFIAKYDPSGNFIYANGMGGAGSDIGNSVSLDASGNAYFTGYYSGVVDFDPGAGTAFLTSPSRDIFLAEYSASGNYVYAKNMGGAGSDAGTSVCVDAGGNVYVTGSFYYLADFDEGITLQSINNGDIFLAKYVPSPIVWTGAVNTDWDTPGNWSGNTVPTSALDAFIPLVANLPAVNSVNSKCRNITINPGASVTVNSGKNLSLYRNWTNNGLSDAGSGTVTFIGSTAQSINGNTSFGNLTINNPSGVSLFGNTELTGVLTPALGTLASNGYLTLASNTSQTAIISGTGFGSVYGNVTMQRYMPSKLGYHYYSSPFTAAPVNEFVDEIGTITSGDPYGGTNDTLQTVTPFPNFYAYDETPQFFLQIGWTGAGATMTPMRGYCINFGAAGGALTTDVTGMVNNGPLSYPVTKTASPYPTADGWNLVGNPYPSPIDWQAASGWTKTNVSDGIYYFKPSTQYTGSYSTFVNGIGANGGTAIIPSMQGFFVKATGAGTLGVTNAVRVNSQPTFFKSTTVTSNPLLRLKGYPAANEPSGDETVIYFDTQATNVFDNDLDAYKWMNNDPAFPNLFTRDDSPSS
ncbi:MAG TPA: SBBP repeat-containing protein, partial [Paludibacteraceae bacterium]|nr:SBBP repeat-containing protein [Paludibacteraceae bacterium]